MPVWPENVALAGRRWQAPYAENPDGSRGRFHKEPEAPLRSPFQRDRDRILHSDAFRRLKHKTQVFVHHEGDHFRTRLTHTLEVSQIARSIARPLGLDEDLTEAIALAHDLGHPPFGHAGERALDRALADAGGFDHNAQSVRVVTELEARYPDFDGLNLTLEMLEGLVKHNGPVLDACGRPAGPYRGGVLPFGFRAVPNLRALDLRSAPSLEAQVAALSDDIAYASHDVEDGLRAGLLDLAAMREVPLAADVLHGIEAGYPALDRHHVVRELSRRMITLMIEDVILTTAEALRRGQIESVTDVKRAREPLVGFSARRRGEVAELKAFLFRALYRHPDVWDRVCQAEAIVSDLFAAYGADPSRLPELWRNRLRTQPGVPLARHVADYIAGMTDRFALLEHRRLFDAAPDLG
ncbi:deoxyguanosinetriphosphate triphosphohydrolase [Propylenella binzhouense]|uniref:deoxyguanosinetriphosphate triphosphohydrolase n=1 Tax=Propylenella binzhouense TaxID=2555902 RepID=UPI0031B60338